VRAVALVVAAVLLSIGLGAIVAGGTGVAPAPRGWVTVQVGQARLSVPADWKILYNQPCAAPPGAGVVHVATHTATYELCALSTDAINRPSVSIGPEAGESGGFRERLLNGMKVWEIGGIDYGLLVDIPALGISVYLTGRSALPVLETLTYAPAG
jgi:hypothetical protein